MKGRVQRTFKKRRISDEAHQNIDRYHPRGLAPHPGDHPGSGFGSLRWVRWPVVNSSKAGPGYGKRQSDSNLGERRATEDEIRGAFRRLLRSGKLSPEAKDLADFVFLGDPGPHPPGGEGRRTYTGLMPGGS